MGVPKQVVDMDAESDRFLEEDAQLAGVGAQTQDGPAAQPEPEPRKQLPESQPEPKAEPPKAEGVARVLDSAGSQDPATASDNLEALRLENQRMRSMMGRLNKDHREQEEFRKSYEDMKAKLAERDAELDRLRRELDESKTSANAGRQGLSSDMMAVLRSKLGDGYSDQELENFAAAVGEIAGAQTRDIREKIAERERQTALDNAAAFKKRLADEFPGFLELDANDDPRWVGFLQSSLGGVMDGTTYGELAAIAAKRLDYRKFSGIVREFQKQTGIQFSTGNDRATQGVAAQMRPRNVPAANSASHGNELPVFGRSEVNRFYRAYQARRAEETFGMTPEQVAETIRRFEDAESDGRIDESR